MINSTSGVSGRTDPGSPFRHNEHAMSNEIPPPNDATATADAPPAASAPSGTPADAPGTPPAPAASNDEGPAVVEAVAVDPVAQLTDERNALREQLLRARADFDNYRKRARRDEQEAVKRAREDVLRELLPVFDNLERAAHFARTSADGKAIGEGVVMVLRLFEDTLGRLGGSRLKAVGSVFDPNLHEAIQQVDSDEHPAGVVVQEYVPGYQFADRLLRAAQVLVSKGPAAPPPASEPDGDAEPVN